MDKHITDPRLFSDTAGSTPERDEVEAAVRTLLRWAGDNPDREGLRDTPELPEVAGIGSDLSSVRKAWRSAYFGRAGRQDAPVYDRAGLVPGMIIDGPALIEEETSTTLLPPGTVASVTDDLGLIIETGAGS